MVVRDSRGGKTGLAVIVLLAFVAGAVVMYVGHHHVLDWVKSLFGK